MMNGEVLDNWCKLFDIKRIKGESDRELSDRVLRRMDSGINEIRHDEFYSCSIQDRLRILIDACDSIKKDMTEDEARSHLIPVFNDICLQKEKANNPLLIHEVIISYLVKTVYHTIKR